MQTPLLFVCRPTSSAPATLPRPTRALRRRG